MSPLQWMPGALKQGCGIKSVTFLYPTASCTVSKRGITGKTLRNAPLPDKKPFPYKTKNFGMLQALIDKCTLRFDENTKLIAIEGAHCVGKSKLAKELAEEFEMLYLPPPTMDELYKTYRGDDLRNYNHCLNPMNKTFDEKDFCRNPFGTVYGSGDRFFHAQWVLKSEQYLQAMRHIFNTGQGVVLERSIFSDYVLYNAAFDAGWIRDKCSKVFYEKCRFNYTYKVLRPNVIIYLDAPVDVVRKNIAAKGNEWDKDSPVWNNETFLANYYDNMKREYLVNATPHSEVLVYDWSEPGDSETVVEDVERLQLDDFGMYEDKQSDWRLHYENIASEYRMRFTNATQIQSLRLCFTVPFYFKARELTLDPPDVDNLTEVLGYMDGGNGDHGFDKFHWKNLFQFDAHETKTRPYFMPPPPPRSMFALTFEGAEKRKEMNENFKHTNI